MKKQTALLMLVILSLVLCACGTDDGGVNSLILSTGDETGTYYSFGNLLAQKVSAYTTTFVATVTSGGSKDNIRALARNEAQLAFTQYDAMIYAREGTNTFRVNGPNSSFSVVAALYPEAVHIVTLDPKITSVADLKGRRVSIGAAGSGIYFNAVDILNAYGLSEKDIAASYYTYSEAVDMLLGGWLDAVFVVAGAPVNVVTALTEDRPIYLISLDEAHIKALTAGDSVYSRAVIEAGVYGTPQDCMTVAVDAVIIADNGVPADEVYDFVRGIYDNVPSLESESRFAEYLSPELAASIAAVPYHPGAARYYAEHGISVPTG